ncbi:MAG: LuxR family transcriptional regulator, partial [Sulfitobacter sp. SK025]
VIAEIMGLSRHTVDTIIRRMFGKLDVTDRTRAGGQGARIRLIHQSSDYLA